MLVRVQRGNMSIWPFLQSFLQHHLRPHRHVILLEQAMARRHMRESVVLDFGETKALLPVPRPSSTYQ